MFVLIRMFFPFFSLTELPVRFLGYNLSLSDTPLLIYTLIFGKESNEAVSIFEECSLLIFQLLLIPA